MRFRVSLVGLMGCLLAVAAPSPAATCESLASLTLPNTTITEAQSVAAGAFAPPQGPPMPNLPAFCRVAGVIKPTADSDIRFEAWMPSSGWNGKFQGVGNGGFAGAIDLRTMSIAVSHGYATASTDTGHRAGGTDASWALGHPQKVADFGFRAIHETAEKAKAIVAAFYGGAAKRSYFAACSNGGRQALMEAQRYPADYDGIIAGAPANDWTHLLTGSLWNVEALTADPASFIPPGKLAAVEAASLAACDTLDGVKDGVIEDATRCHFDPGVLLCKGDESGACLTAPQLAALRKIYGGPRDSKGRQIFPGYPPGGEAAQGGWAAWITGPEPGKSVGFAFGTQFFTHMVFENAAWDRHTFDAGRDAKAADDKLAKILNATAPDLKPFKDRGGKLILYHGWSDAAIPAASTIAYYQSATAKMGARDAGSFIRLFMVPGMGHCGGGEGPDSFGGGTPPLAGAERDMSAALERWVEQGAAPNQVIATKYKTGANPASGIVRTRPLCAWPEIAHWNGTGSTDDAASFTCGK